MTAAAPRQRAMRRLADQRRLRRQGRNDSVAVVGCVVALFALFYVSHRIANVFLVSGRGDSPVGGALNAITAWRPPSSSASATSDASDADLLMSQQVEEMSAATNYASSALAESNVTESRQQRQQQSNRSKRPANVEEYLRYLAQPFDDRLDATLFPDGHLGDDRIEAQIAYVPPHLARFKTSNGSWNASTMSQMPRKKVILLWNAINSWGGQTMNTGSSRFSDAHCNVDWCTLTTRRHDIAKADLVIFKDRLILPHTDKVPGQLWMAYSLESPRYSVKSRAKFVDSAFDWTASYRSDSVLVTPYERWQYHDPTVTSKAQDVNYAAMKSRDVVTFISHCTTANNRLGYARELARHIPVDIYGSCGSKRCRSTKQRDCMDTVVRRHYRFYLAFENSNCREYITEKLYVNALRHDTVPIVMGAHPDDYAAHAPHHSFIHVDEFASPAALAAYLHQLASDDAAYNAYFAWKGTGGWVDTKFFCRACALLHYPDVARVGQQRQFASLSRWWRPRGICTNKSWLNRATAESTTLGKVVAANSTVTV